MTSLEGYLTQMFMPNDVDGKVKASVLFTLKDSEDRKKVGHPCITIKYDFPNHDHAMTYWHRIKIGTREPDGEGSYIETDLSIVGDLERGRTNYEGSGGLSF